MASCSEATSSASAAVMACSAKTVTLYMTRSFVVPVTIMLRWAAPAKACHVAKPQVGWRDASACQHPRAAGRLPCDIWSVREDLREVVADDLLELVIGARLGGAIRAPALELRRVPQPRPLHVVVPNLHHEYRVNRDPGQVFLRVPARNGSRQAAELMGLCLCPLTPRMVPGIDEQGLELFDEL